jgi:glycine cleavage system H protein
MSIVRYTRDHEWIELDDDGIGTVGITDYAQSQLGDVVFVELPETGRILDPDDEAAVVESVKAASEVYAPVAGEIVAVNERLADEPGLVNTDPMGEGWFIRLKVADPAKVAALLDQGAYEAYVTELE